MDLPSIFSRTQKKDEVRTFLALEIGSEAITAGLWMAGLDGVEILKYSSPIQWSGEDAKDAVEAADVALEELGAEASKVDDVMLGLRADWVTASGIENEKKKIIKSLKDELQLNPIGFVVTDEALTHYLQDIEGAPVTAFLLRYSESQLQLSLVTAGKIEAQEFIGRSGDAVADLSEGFARMKTAHFPSRILLSAERLKQEQLEEEKQTFLAHDWKSSFPFAHIPKVEVLEPRVMISAVCVAGGSEVARALGILDPSQEEPVQTAQNNASESLTATDEQDEPLPKPVPPAQEELPLPPLPPQPKYSVEIEQDSSFMTPDFSNQNNLQSEVLPPPWQPTQTQMPADEELSEDIMQEDMNIQSVPEPRKEHALRGLQRNSTAFIQRIFQKTTQKLHVNRMRTDDVNEGLVEALQTKRLPVKKLLLFVGLPLLLLFAIGGGYVYADSSLRASLSIKLKLEPISKEIDATIDSKAQTLVIGETSIPIQIVEDLVDGKKDAQTTGKDKVGESSSGTVTLYNRTSSEKTFPKDTKLTGAGGLVFSTTEDVKIASSSSGSDFSIQPGKAEVKVVATKIGPNYNVASGTEFTVANFDKISFIASNAQAFSGGSSSEIQVVSKTDLSNLESQLKKELLEKPTTQQQNTISLDLAEVKDKTTSHDLGDETTQLEMSMTIARKSATLSQDAMLEIIQVLFAEEIAKGSVDLTSVEVFAVDQSQKQIKDGTELRLAVRAKIQPQFAIDRLLPQIQGRTPDQVSTLLSTYKEIESHKLTRSPAVLPTLFGRLPKDASAITITIEK